MKLRPILVGTMTAMLMGEFVTAEAAAKPAIFQKDEIAISLRKLNGDKCKKGGLCLTRPWNKKGGRAVEYEIGGIPFRTNKPLTSTHGDTIQVGVVIDHDKKWWPDGHAHLDISLDNQCRIEKVNLKINEGSTAKIAKTIVGYSAGAAAAYTGAGTAAAVVKDVAGQIAETIAKSFEDNQAKVFSQLMTHHVNFVYEACMVRDFKAPKKAK